MKKSLFVFLAYCLISVSLSLCAMFLLFDDDIEKNDKIIENWVEKNPEKIIYSLNKMAEREEVKLSKELINKGKKDYKNQVFESESVPFLGQKDSEMLLITFLDYSCFYCRITKNYPEILLEEFPEMKFMIIPVVNATNERSKILAKYSIGMFLYDKNKFKEMHKEIFLLDTMVSVNNDKMGELLEKMEVDKEEFENFLVENKDKIERQIAYNNAAYFVMGIDGTPAFIYGDEKISGAVPSDDLIKIINKLNQKNEKDEKDDI